MARRLSRRALAEYAAATIERGDDAARVVKQLAAHLIENKRTKEADLIVRDIEQQLSDRGVVVGQTVSAFTLSGSLQAAIEQDIKKQTGARQISLVYRTDPDVLGGYRVSLPGKRLDRTVRTHLTNLKTRFKKV